MVPGPQHLPGSGDSPVGASRPGLGFLLGDRGLQLVSIGLDSRVLEVVAIMPLAGPNPPVVLDVRSRSQYQRDGVRIPGSVRVLPDQITEWAAGRLRDQLHVLYCT